MAEEPPSLSCSESVFGKSLMLKTSPASDAEVTASSPGGPRADWEVTRALENESSAPARTGEESLLESVFFDAATTTTEASEAARESACASSVWALAIAPNSSPARFEFALELESSADAAAQLPDHATAGPASVCASPKVAPFATAISALVAASSCSETIGNSDCSAAASSSCSER